MLYIFIILYVLRASTAHFSFVMARFGRPHQGLNVLCSDSRESGKLNVFTALFSSIFKECRQFII